MMRKIVVNLVPTDYFDEYHYNAQIWTFHKETWWYSGEGRYCKTIEEVVQYAKDKNLLVEFR